MSGLLGVDRRFDPDRPRVVVDFGPGIGTVRWYDAIRVDAPTGDDIEHLETGYARRLAKVSRKATRETTARLSEDLGDIVGLGGPQARRRMVTRANKIATELRKALPAKLIEQDAEHQAARTFLASGQRWRRFARQNEIPSEIAQLGNDLDPGKAIKVFRRRQVELVREAIEEHRAGLVRELRDRLRPGANVEALRKIVDHRLGVLERRLESIARNETQDLIGALDRMRHKAAGVTSYTWRTQRDARVREAHRQREGKQFENDEPPPDGHPGQPPNCRCWAEPFFDRDKLKAAAAPKLEEEIDAEPLPEGSPGFRLRQLPELGREPPMGSRGNTADEIPIRLEGKSPAAIRKALAEQGFRGATLNASRAGRSGTSRYQGVETTEQATAIAIGERPQADDDRVVEPLRVSVTIPREGEPVLYLKDGNHRLLGARLAGATHHHAEVRTFVEDDRGDFHERKAIRAVVAVGRDRSGGNAP